MKGGEQEWVLTARDANYSNDKTSLILNDPVVTLVSKDGKPVTVKAPKAVLDIDGGKVKRATLSGGTNIHYGEFVMTTDVAIFLPDADQVDAPGFVTIEGEGIKATGVGMTGHTKTRKVYGVAQPGEYQYRAAASRKSGFQERLNPKAGIDDRGRPENFSRRCGDRAMSWTGAGTASQLRISAG